MTNCGAGCPSLTGASSLSEGPGDAAKIVTHNMSKNLKNNSNLFSISRLKWVKCLMFPVCGGASCISCAPFTHRSKRNKMYPKIVTFNLNHSCGEIVSGAGKTISPGSVGRENPFILGCSA